MVKDAREAGVPAFEFPPDATPEQRAAMAKRVRCHSPIPSVSHLVSPSVPRIGGVGARGSCDLMARRNLRLIYLRVIVYTGRIGYRQS